MAANRKRELHATGDAKMKAAAIKYAARKTASGPRVKAINEDQALEAVPSPARQLQEQLQAHYQPLNQKLSVILVSLLVAFAFIGGWVGRNGMVGIA